MLQCYKCKLLTRRGKRCHIADLSCWMKHELKYHFLTIKKLALTIMCHFFSRAHSMISLCLIKGLNQQRKSGASLRGNSYRLLSKFSLLKLECNSIFSDDLKGRCIISQFSYFKQTFDFYLLSFSLSFLIC